MENFEELLPEIYALLLILDISMSEEEALQSLKSVGFDQNDSTFILETARKTQKITTQHKEKLSEICEEDQLTEEQTEQLIKAYLKSQEVDDELIEVVYLYYYFLESVDIAEGLILEGEKQGISQSEIRAQLRQLSELDAENADTLFFSAMNRLGKPIEEENEAVAKGRRLIWIAVAVLIVTLLVFIFDENTAYLYTGLGLSVLLMVIGFVGVTRAS